MRYTLSVSLLLCLFLVMMSCSSEQQQEPRVSGVKHIIIIGIDGLSPDGIENSDSPHIHHFINNGASTMRARAVLPTSSSPNWASMIMGVGPELHGITSNSWERDNFILPPITTGPEPMFPTVFTLIRNNISTAEIGVIYHWSGFGRLFEESSVSYSVNATNEQDAADKAAAYIREKKPLLTFVHLDHVDGAGHTYGHGTSQYYAAVGRADKLVGEIVDAVKRAGTYNETIFIITSDHGGIGKGHGGQTLAEVEIPFVIAGRSVKKNYEINTSFVQFDNAATVAFALNIEQPAVWTGRPAKTVFEGFPEEAIE